MITLYGIPNCDTVRRARNALQAAGVDFRFHDFRIDGLTADLVSQWVERLGADRVLNRRGTTWRKLSADQQASADTEQLPYLLAEFPALIRRPVFDRDGELRVGFAAKDASVMLEWLSQ